MADKSNLIIGAGIAGLSAGCYVQMNGYRTHISELRSLPGGLPNAVRSGRAVIRIICHKDRAPFSTGEGGL